jgi:F0F1-type ATP synthase assembly protein I
MDCIFGGSCNNLLSRSAKYFAISCFLSNVFIGFVIGFLVETFFCGPKAFLIVSNSTEAPLIPETP